MYSFDGEYRRRPIQNLSGSTEVCDRDAIIRKAQIERQKRNELRIQNNGAIVLQSYTRSFIHRQRKKKLEREKFDEFLNEYRGQLSDDGNLTYLIRRILFFYSSKNQKDCDRLIDICQFMIRNPGSILEKAVSDSLWLHRIKKMLSICLEQLTVPNASQAIPMRMIETFSSDSVVGKYVTNTDLVRTYLEQIFRFLVERQYFKRIRMILDEKCPPLDGETLVAPNPTCEALYQMILRPLTITYRGFGSSSDICKSFAEHILSAQLTSPIRYFVVPCLAQHSEFPFSQLISSLATTLLIGEEPMDVDNIDSEQKIKSIFTVFLLHELLVLDKHQITKQKKLNDLALMRNYTAIISEISSKVIQLPKSSLQLSSNVNTVDMAEDDSDSDSEVDDRIKPTVNKTSLSDIEIECLLEIIESLNSAERVSAIVESVGKFATDERILYNISNICHSLMVHNKNAVYDYKILYTLAFMPNFIRSLWFTLATQSKRLGFSSPLSWISKGVVPKHHRDIERTIPFLATFCAMFGRLVPTLHDAEFCEESMVDENIHRSNLMPFTIAEIIQLSKTLKEISMGLVDLAFPDTRSNLNEHYRNVTGRSSSEDEQIKQRKLIWSNLLKVVVSVLNQIYTRDLRRGFCPDGHWTVSTLNLPLDRPNDLPLTRGSRTRGIRPFQPIRDFTREDFENGPPMSMKQIRSITILREIPFIVAFSNRVSILQGLIAADKIRVQGDLQGFLQGPSINLSVRRTHLYEDAFDKLRPENEPDLRHKFRVQFFSSLGLEEAGIDGGGVFREFLSELIKSAFDPNRGFFMVTTDNKLYPNPTVADITPDFEKHYYFMGRILGKVIYENLLVELPLAEFFLTKLAGKYSDVDVHQLASLDPELYKNLLSLKEYDGDVSELGLDFTVVSNSLGQTQVTELKPNGQSIPVTSSNRIEYIQLNADYKLNKQIRAQCVAFRRGLSNVLPVEWLYMFSNKELQILLSGAEIPIDLEDLKKHCKYGGEYSPEHRSIMCFWKVLEGFTDLQKRQLLKFVTSCSRPPLLGFKDLDPPFFIQNTGDEERLPTASTCTNLLKLPPFKTEEQMREKLLYAIQSGAGFELS